jgi:FMN phosphatase YigB (HAD superfamily)
MIIEQFCSRQQRTTVAFPATRPVAGAHACISGTVVGVVCEVAGTLYDDTCWWRWMTQLVSHMGVHVDFESFYQRWDAEYFDDVCRGRNDFWQALRSYLYSCGLSRGLCDEVLVAGQARYRHLDQGVRPLAGVRETLTRLSSQPLALVAVCNSACPTSHLHARLKSIGLDTCFDNAISSRDLGDTMSAPSFFRKILAANDLPADRTAFVSNQERHLAGAAAGGMLTVAFNHRTPVAADIHVDRFLDLLDILPCGGSRRMAG